MGTPTRMVARLLPLLLLLPAGCFDWMRTTDTPADHSSQGEGAQDDTDEAAGPEESDVTVAAPPRPPLRSAEQEESEMEDPDALHALIAEKLSRPAADEYDSEPRRTDAESPTAAPSLVPPAATIMKMSAPQCRRNLKKHKVPFTVPTFDTPLVDTPILLTGPIGGVRIAPLHPEKKPVHAVMDCRLALALVETARVAAAHGITDIEFYSTYRPLRRPPKTCPKGRSGKKCRAAKKRYRQTAAAKKSQHRFARAIDIRRLKTASGDIIDVLEDFDRRSGRPPCERFPKSEKARLLTDFVCTLHERKVFNVMLTPNANKAHHNHFHFDLTPHAGWYIVR